jgi:hypothetical protein
MKFELSAFPLFMGQSIVLFEANASLLNVYAEHRYPKQMYTSTVKMHIVIVVLACLVGWLSYYAFGDEVQEIVLYDLPEGKPFTILTQIFYMLNVMGCFVL